MNAIRRNRSVQIGMALLVLVAATAVLAPPLAGMDPLRMTPEDRLSSPVAAHPFGTDMFGRDILARTLHGGRVSLSVGLAVAAVALAAGLGIGLVAGYVRAVDRIVMRVMDGIMAIPGILLAIALIALSGATLGTVVVAIAVPEVPRVVRLVRSVVLAVREEPYVEAAVAAGARLPRLLVRHVLPNTLAPLIVQGSYVCASAMIVESILGFLGAGMPPEVPSWGNVMAEGRTFFQIAPWILFFPGAFLAVTVLSVNLLGDGLRDTLDPRLRGRFQ
ncbi:MAG: ABC transporter permease [Alphaproteobacteria bacterium]|nr:ABC transporter permease [Alphaproteobacteria bacterium]